MSRKGSAWRIVLGLMFLAYTALMLWLLFGQRLDGGMTAEQNWNWVPFNTLKVYIRIVMYTENAALLRHAIINLGGNVIMFLPLGFFLAGIWRKQRNFFLCLLTCAVIIAAIEAVQYFTRLGSCDVDDFILNLPGAMLGYGFQRLISRSRR